MGFLQARETERRQQTPATYQESAKAAAQRACVGREPADVFECVYEHAEASQQTSYAEQDLSAQQRAASAALIAAVIAFLTLIVTAIGVVYIRKTLDATLEAVEDTSAATEAMKKANEIAETSARLQLRAYMAAKSLQLRWDNLAEKYVFSLVIVNNGPTPATIARIKMSAVWITKTHATPIMNSDATLGVDIHRDTPNHMPFKFDAKFKRSAQKGHIIVFGIIFYTDIFGKAHRESFSWTSAQDDQTRFDWMDIPVDFSACPFGDAKRSIESRKTDDVKRENGGDEAPR